MISSKEALAEAMHQQEIVNHRLVVLARSAALHHITGDAPAYVIACKMLSTMALNEMRSTEKAIADKLREGGT